MSLAAALHPAAARALPSWTHRVPAFVGVGLVWTLLYLGTYALLRPVLDAQVANAVALVATTVGGTDSHRRVTFRVREHTTRSRLVHQLVGLLLLGATLGTTTAALWLLHAVAPGASTGVEVAALLVANGLGGCLRFGVFQVLMTPVGHDAATTVGAGWSHDLDLVPR